MTRKPSDDEPFSGLAFKVMADQFLGTLTFVRVYRHVASLRCCRHSPLCMRWRRAYVCNPTAKMQRRSMLRPPCRSYVAWLCRRVSAQIQQRCDRLHARDALNP